MLVRRRSDDNGGDVLVLKHGLVILEGGGARRGGACAPQNWRVSITDGNQVRLRQCAKRLHNFATPGPKSNHCNLDLHPGRGAFRCRFRRLREKFHSAHHRHERSERTALQEIPAVEAAIALIWIHINLGLRAVRSHSLRLRIALFQAQRPLDPTQNMLLISLAHFLRVFTLEVRGGVGGPHVFAMPERV
jgi:hypothetical protein